MNCKLLTLGYSLDDKLAYCTTPLFFAHFFMDAFPHGWELLYKWNLMLGLSFKHFILPFFTTSKIQEGEGDLRACHDCSKRNRFNPLWASISAWQSIILSRYASDDDDGDSADLKQEEEVDSSVILFDDKEDDASNNDWGVSTMLLISSLIANWSLVTIFVPTPNEITFNDSSV